jgi:hypothetical protein
MVCCKLERSRYNSAFHSVMDQRYLFSLLKDEA